MKKEIYKVIVVGNSGVGKTSLTQKYVMDLFIDNEPNTIGVAYLTKIYNHRERNVTKKVCIWDTAGQERFFSIVQMYFKDCQGVVCVYDVTDIKSLMDCDMWIQEAKKYIHEQDIDEANIPIFLLGNKYDLLDSNAEIKRKYELQKEKIKSLIEHYKNIYNVEHYETNAKYGDNLDRIFLNLIKYMTPKSYDDDCIDLLTSESKKEKCCILS
jgi:small GTP-binding protein